MLILGIETSCDETSSAILEGGHGGIKIISNVVFSQEKIHSKFFGVVPEFASRAHLEKINWVIEKALGGKKLNQIDAVSVTVGPGLMGSLLVGKTVAQTIAYVLNKPIVPVNHIEGHIFSIFLENKIKPPFLALVVSGGHTELVIVEKIGRYKVIGKTRDDAAGEAFDKVAKLLNLKYPGGPEIERLSKTEGNYNINFPRPYMPETFDFSFSGLKTAVVYYVRDNFPDGIKKMKPIDISSICYSFQKAVIDTLVWKTIMASKKFNMKKLVVCGGVSANMALREEFILSGKKEKIDIYFPSRKLSTDNAAMIACVGYYKIKNAKFKIKNLEIKVDPNLKLTNWQ